MVSIRSLVLRGFGFAVITRVTRGIIYRPVSVPWVNDHRIAARLPSRYILRN